MLKDFVGAVWRRVPGRVRRWTLRLTHTRFVVTAGGIITNNEGGVLLLKHRFRPGTGWGMPGGFVEQGEQPEAALRRELCEEVGLEVEKVELFTTRTFKAPKQIEIIFRCQAVGDTDRLSFEIQKAAWFSPGELPPELPKDQAQLIRRALNDGARLRN